MLILHKSSSLSTSLFESRLRKRRRAISSILEKKGETQFLPSFPSSSSSFFLLLRHPSPHFSITTPKSRFISRKKIIKEEGKKRKKCDFWFCCCLLLSMPKLIRESFFLPLSFSWQQKRTPLLFSSLTNLPSFSSTQQQTRSPH